MRLSERNASSAEIMPVRDAASLVMRETWFLGTCKSVTSQLKISFASGTAPGKSLNCFNAYLLIPMIRANRRGLGLGLI